jgi:hypothetical protein
VPITSTEVPERADPFSVAWTLPRILPGPSCALREDVSSVAAAINWRVLQTEKLMSWPPCLSICKPDFGAPCASREDVNENESQSQQRSYVPSVLKATTSSSLSEGSPGKEIRLG